MNALETSQGTIVVDKEMEKLVKNVSHSLVGHYPELEGKKELLGKTIWMGFTLFQTPGLKLDDEAPFVSVLQYGNSFSS